VPGPLLPGTHTSAVVPVEVEVEVVEPALEAIVYLLLPLPPQRFP